MGDTKATMLSKLFHLIVSGTVALTMQNNALLLECITSSVDPAGCLRKSLTPIPPFVPQQAHRNAIPWSRCSQCSCSCKGIYPTVNVFLLGCVPPRVSSGPARSQCAKVFWVALTSACPPPADSAKAYETIAEESIRGDRGWIHGCAYHTEGYRSGVGVK